jgi:hypothetical protein
MAAIRAEKHEHRHAPEPQVEDEIGLHVQSTLPRNSQAQGTAPHGDLSAVISRVSGASVMEIDGLIDQLQGFRDYLRGETERVQREIAQYAQMSRAAAESTKIIADALSRWRR